MHTFCRRGISGFQELGTGEYFKETKGKPQEKMIRWIAGKEFLRAKDPDVV